MRLQWSSLDLVISKNPVHQENYDVEVFIHGASHKKFYDLNRQEYCQLMKEGIDIGEDEVQELPC